MKLLSLSCILLLMATLPAESVPVSTMARTPAVVRALAWLDANSDWITEQQVRLTEIPAPSFQEAKRAEALQKIFQSFGLKAYTDKEGSIVADRAGASKDVLLVAAHLDTVFPAGTNVKVQRQGSRLVAPGIADNGAGLAALVAVARALQEARIKTHLTIVFAGDMGEEGEGNLRGIRALVEAYRSRLRSVIALDGAATDYVTTRGLASRRYEVSITGPGGHSWSDFGTPNPITALARGIVRFSGIRLADSPQTSFNFGVIQGGTSVNSIPDRASVKLDMRSEEEPVLARLESTLKEAMEAGIREEMAAARAGTGTLDLKIATLGVRPAGKLPDNSPLAVAIRDVDNFLGNRTREERSSTDANYPLSIGIPAIALGGGGAGGGAHTLREWYDPSGRPLGVRRALLAILAVAGVRQ